MSQRTDTVKRTIAEVVAERKTQMSPGATFVEAFAKDGFDTSVDYDVTITDSLTSSRRKPRYPSRNMLKVVDLSRDPQDYYWHESPPRPDDPAVDGADLRREAANHFHRSPIPPLLTTTAWVQVPDTLWEDPVSFAQFIDYRLVVRLATAENHTILRGEGGLLTMPDLGRLTDPGPFASTVLAACNEVEQMGSTADGLIINPADYYQLLGSGSLMRDVEDNGVFIVRTRLVDPGTAIVGDFGHGALLFDAGRSTIGFAEPPPGTFAEPGVALRAEIWERVVVNLPTCFFVVTL
ncbi:family 3 encapsulin nanocompartment shell protein [Micromonospora tulbaghiae]|uniref:family 3 encapsulin nanocompartment shell protein n=1 Tax=Micromonospora tulbaghiae TaxID=479978 RepID=UPI0033A1EF76